MRGVPKFFSTYWGHNGFKGKVVLKYSYLLDKAWKNTYKNWFFLKALFQDNIANLFVLPSLWISLNIKFFVLEIQNEGKNISVNF